MSQIWGRISNGPVVIGLCVRAFLKLRDDAGVGGKGPAVENGGQHWCVFRQRYKDRRRSTGPMRLRQTVRFTRQQGSGTEGAELGSKV